MVRAGVISDVLPDRIGERSLAGFWNDRQQMCSVKQARTATMTLLHDLTAQPPVLRPRNTG
jgi:hypothetical protein